MAFLNLTGLKYFYDKISAIFAKDSEVVKSVNNITPTDGHVHVARVDYADNLVADDAQASSGTFIARTSGGDASISDGDASLTTLKGTSQHTGYSAGSLSMAVYPVSIVPRSETITVSSDSATFKNQIRNDAAVTFTYTGSWNVDPASYGVTITGTPESGDSVTATYVKSTDTTNVSVDADSSGITATVNASTFKDAILEDTTVVLSYSSAWNYNPATYGLTVTGTPLSGDVITAVYIKSSDTLNVTTTLVPTEPRTGTITAAIDEDVWSFSGASSGTTTFTYTTGWNANLSTYGITVTGSPVSGDSIVVDYTPEVRGTITHPQLGSFVSTGWNLYDDSVGYARCLKYSDSYGFLIGGSFTSIGFTTDPSLPAETIAPVEVSEGVYSFDINDDGFVMVTGGDDTTYIMMTWSDWTEGYEGDFETYRVSEIDLSSLSAFPYGLMAAGAIADEIDFTYSTYTSRIGRMTYNYSNLMTAKNSGRAYEYDEDYIYFEKETYESSDFVIDPAYTVSDHGIEFFTGTDTPFWASMLYGQNLKDKLRTDVLTISAQDLTSTQKTQVKTNLGLVSDLAGKKNTQTAVSDPSASGTSTTFIATLTQNAQGVITPTKKTVSTMGAATSSAAGTAGLVPAPAKGKQAAFLRGDGTWVVPTDTTYSAGTGLSLSSTTFSLATSGATAGSYGPSADVTGNNNTTIDVPRITVDKYGRVTAISNKTYTSKNTTYSAMTGATADDAGAAGLVPKPAAGKQAAFLRGDGTWTNDTSRSIVKVQTTKRDLIVKYGDSGGTAHHTEVDITFPTAFPSACIGVLAICKQTTYSVPSTITVSEYSKTGFTIHQANTASTTMSIHWIAFGY